jgi:hypothetical protein
MSSKWDAPLCYLRRQLYPSVACHPRHTLKQYAGGLDLPQAAPPSLACTLELFSCPAERKCRPTWAEYHGKQAFQKYNKKLALRGFRPKQAVPIDHSGATGPSNH